MPWLDVSEKDEIKGTMTYLATENKWKITTEDTSKTSVKSECTSNALDNNQNLRVFGGALEGHWLYDDNDLPGNIKFYSMTFKDKDDKDVSVSLVKWILDGTSQFAGLDVDVSGQPSTTVLKTGKS